MIPMGSLTVSTVNLIAQITRIESACHIIMIEPGATDDVS